MLIFPQYDINLHHRDKVTDHNFERQGRREAKICSPIKTSVFLKTYYIKGNILMFSQGKKIDTLFVCVSRGYFIFVGANTNDCNRLQSEGGWRIHDGGKISYFHFFLSLCKIML